MTQHYSDCGHPHAPTDLNVVLGVLRAIDVARLEILVRGGDEERLERQADRDGLPRDQDSVLVSEMENETWEKGT